MRKSLIALFLIAVLCLSLTACGKAPAVKPDDGGKNTKTTEIKPAPDRETDSSDKATTVKPDDDDKNTNNTETEPAPAPSFELSSAGERLAKLGFAESDFLFAEDDYMEVDEEGDITLYTTATPEQVAQACFDACKRAADDGKVRDYWTEEEMDFEFDPEAFMTTYGYFRGGNFCDLAICLIFTHEDTGVNEYLLQW